MNSDTSVVIVDPCTGEDDLTKDNLLIYPNPFNDLIVINGIKEASQVEIYNAMGELVLSEFVNSSSAKYDLTKESKGIYMLRIINQDGVTVKQIVKH